jgi:hypothetical protein
MKNHGQTALALSWAELSVGCAASVFCPAQRKLPPANIENPILGFIQRFPKERGSVAPSPSGRGKRE